MYLVCSRHTEAGIRRRQLRRKPPEIVAIEAQLPEPEPLPEEPIRPVDEFAGLSGSMTPLRVMEYEMSWIAGCHGITLEEVRGPRRFKELVAARRDVAHHLRSKWKLSFPRIGRLMGGRDHTTVMNLLRKRIR